MEAEAKQNEKKAQTVKAEAELDIRETGEELLGHRMLLDEVTGPFACSDETTSKGDRWRR